MLLDSFGKDSCLGTKKYFIDSIGNGVLFEFGNLKKPFGLLKEFLEENIEFQVFAHLSSDKIKGCLYKNHHLPGVTILWFCKEFQTTHSGIQIDTQMDIEEYEVPGFLRYIIYKILQEALNNVARYSKANLVQLLLSKRGATVEFTIQDNSQGFNMKEALMGSRISLSFNSMRGRAEIADGSCAIKSAIEKGTIIRASWPI